MPDTFADRLGDAVRRKGSPAVVALDPVFSQLPKELQARAGAQGQCSPASELEAVVQFSHDVLRIMAPHVPVVKINSAYFERYHGRGVAEYYRLVGAASRLGLIVIGDVKRGDVGHTAEMYAIAHLEAPVDDGNVPDAITIGGYFGRDGAAPFIESAQRQGRGVFVLVRTSNPSAAVIQDAAMSNGRRVHELVAAEVARWAAESGTIGRNGYSGVGAVVATRNAVDAAKLRALLPQSWLLVPGYGAQGGRAEDFAQYFKADGSGALIAAGRSVIFAYQASQQYAALDSNWQACVEQACKDFVADLKRVVPGRSS
jgi:orotidine-5'-phosphate decarboxylase